MTDNTTPPTPPTPPASPDEPTQQLSPAPAPAQPAAPASPRRRTALMITGVAAAVLLAAGAGAGITLALNDGDDDDITGFNSSSQSNGSNGNGFDGPNDSAPTAADGETDLDGMLDAATQALTVAQGDVVKIEERSPGSWRVEVQGGGREYEVLVESSGARVVEEDDDDDGDDLPLTADIVRSLVDAATANTAGRVVQVESDDNRYQVDVRTSTGANVELELDQDFRVVGTDVDDDRDDD